jgi:hypothetical protein
MRFTDCSVFINHHSQCSRARGKGHPTSELRHYPLLQSVQGVQDLANVVVFDSNPLSYETDQMFCFCNKRDDGSEMIMCETCEMYYHSYCIGKSGAELDGFDYLCVGIALVARMRTATSCGKVI